MTEIIVVCVAYTFEGGRCQVRGRLAQENEDVAIGFLAAN
jgi:hypothetical protein